MVTESDSQFGYAGYIFLASLRRGLGFLALFLVACWDFWRDKMPAAIQDNVSSCRSSPMQWQPIPVPAPFDVELATSDENVSWEHCMRILNNGGGRSLTRATAAAYPIFGGDRQLKRSGTPLGRYLVQSPEHGVVPRNLSGRLADVKVEEVAVTIRDGSGARSGHYQNSVSRATSPMPSEFSDFPTNAEGSKDPSPERNAQHSSILKRIFGPRVQRGGKKNLSRTSSISSLFRFEEPGKLPQVPKKPTKSPQPRLSSVALTGEADPRISSTNLTADAFDCREEFGARQMNRWLRHQHWMAMASKAEGHLNELSEMLQYTMRSLEDVKESGDFAEEMQQRRNSLYYAS